MSGPMRIGRAIVAAGALALIVKPVAGQPMPPPAQRPAAPADLGTGPFFTPPAMPSIAPVVPPTVSARPETLSLSASFTGDPRPIRSGLVWRIYEEKAGTTPALVAKLNAPTPTATLPPGSYVIHAAYGLASATKRLTMAGAPVTDKIVIGAGALKLAGGIGEIPIPAARLAFSIYQPLPNDNEGKLVAANIKAGELVRLPEGTYHVVSTYGESNAIMRTDLKVDRGRITEATLNHRAATMTLKLVTGIGGEAFAGTAFSVLTPGGDVIREAIGAFPTVTLAEGDYVLIARHNGKVYTQEFKVESGFDRDVEVAITPG